MTLSILVLISGGGVVLPCMRFQVPKFKVSTRNHSHDSYYRNPYNLYLGTLDPFGSMSFGVSTRNHSYDPERSCIWVLWALSWTSKRSQNNGPISQNREYRRYGVHYFYHFGGPGLGWALQAEASCQLLLRMKFAWVRGWSCTAAGSFQGVHLPTVGV